MIKTSVTNNNEPIEEDLKFFFFNSEYLSYTNSLPAESSLRSSCWIFPASPQTGWCLKYKKKQEKRSSAKTL